ncbi:MAG: hypothetical protein OXH00_26190 [Candidatus Poribacteria bacterium]|nr:hypothetical protein [Candidatus Poribacteria bacterium]
MSKYNGNGKSTVEKHHFDNPEALPIGNGISIAATGEGDTPSEVQLYCKVPGAQFASRFTFREPVLLTDFIEQLIAYRRLVFPDAPEIDTNATLDDPKEVDK